MRFSFEVPGKPVAQGSMRALGPNRMVHHNHTALMPYRATVAAHAHAQQPPGWDTSGPMGVEVSFWLPRPQGHYAKRGGLKPTAPWWPVGRVGDLDKFVRALLDALTDAGVWHDDSQVCQLTAQKLYSDEPAGHLHCTITRLPERAQ